MTQFNKGPAYGLSAEVRSKVRIDFTVLCTSTPVKRRNGVYVSLHCIETLVFKCMKV